MFLGARLAGGKAPAGCHGNKIPRFHGNCMVRLALTDAISQRGRAGSRRTQAQRRHQRLKQPLPCCPRPHSRQQVQLGTDLPPSLMNFPGSLCSADGSGLTYPEAREPEDSVQSSGALRRRLTDRLRLQHDTAEGGSTRCVSL